MEFKGSLIAVRESSTNIFVKKKKNKFLEDVTTLHKFGEIETSKQVGDFKVLSDETILNTCEGLGLSLDPINGFLVPKFKMNLF